MHFSEYILTKFVSKFVFITQWTKEYYKIKYNLWKIAHHVIPSWVDFKKFNLNFSAWQKVELKEFYGINLNMVILGYVGTIARMRELDKLISQNIEEIKKSSVQFVFIWDGDWLIDLEKVFTENWIEKHVVFLGKKTSAEVPKIMQIFDYWLCHLPDIFVFQNSFPLKVLEYIAAWKNVVCSDISAHRNLQLRFGDWISIYEENKLPLQDLKSTQRYEQSMTKIIEEYDWSNLSHQYAQIYAQ